MSRGVRISRIGFIVMLVVICLTSTVYGFTDIRETDWYYKDIKGLKDNGVIAGYSDNTYRPNNNVTSAEALTMVLRATKYNIPNNDKGHWGTSALMTAVENKIVKDMTSFYFDDSSTRVEVAEYLSKALNLEIDENNTNPIFEDTSNSHVIKLYDEGILTGVEVSGGRFYYPDKPISRAEIGVIVSRVMNYGIIDNEEEIIEEQEIKEIVEEELEELEEIEENQTLTLVSPLKDSEYGVEGDNRTQEDLEKVLVYMGYNNLTTLNIEVKGMALDEVKSEDFKGTMSMAFKTVFGKYPEYYSFSNGIGYTRREKGDNVELEIVLRNPNFTEEEIKKYRKDFINAVDKQLESFIDKGDLTKEMSEYDKAKFVYDWVIQNTSYDYDYTPLGYTGYGQIKLNKAVCQGYVATYNLMLRRLGIEAYGISGESTNDSGTELHIWTIAYLDGERYHIDPTWGDAYDKSSGKTDYKYFATNGKELSKTHSWDRDIFGD